MEAGAAGVGEEKMGVEEEARAWTQRRLANLRHMEEVRVEGKASVDGGMQDLAHQLSSSVASFD